MIAVLSSAALQGIDAELVHVEVNTGERGQPGLIVVGLPDTGVRESRDRVSSALTNSGFRLPWSRTTINLAPGHIRKEGPCYDLPIALGLLLSTEQLAAPGLERFLIVGELSLSGATRAVRGSLAIGRLARRLGKEALLIPAGSAREAALVEGLRVFAIESLDQAFRFLRGERELAPVDPSEAMRLLAENRAETPGDFSEIKGQRNLRRAVEVAVAGNHNVLTLYRDVD